MSDSLLLISVVVVSVMWFISGYVDNVNSVMSFVFCVMLSILGFVSGLCMMFCIVMLLIVSNVLVSSVYSRCGMCRLISMCVSVL